MKQKDIMLVIVMSIISAVVAFLLSRWIFATPQSRAQTAEVVDVITADFPEPPSKYFKANSINPTQLIEIGNSANPNPFNTQQ